MKAIQITEHGGPETLKYQDVADLEPGPGEALLELQAGIPGSELLLATVGGVVMASVAIHGGTATPVGVWYGRTAARETLVEERESTVAGLFGDRGDARTPGTIRPFVPTRPAFGSGRTDPRQL